MKNHLTPLAILIGAIIISITTYVALTKPKQDLIKKRMNTCIERWLSDFGAKSLNELEKTDTRDGQSGEEFVLQQCRFQIYK